ncbi:hypothetical protein evm_000824 [Chilo suppressalis]|nr:hypothetical protein evm_000824 [Chilo suppressalis]
MQLRYGVAPDHPEVKNVINQFTKVAQHPNVNFYGNVTLGKDVTLCQLRQNYDAVLLCYGADEDKTLGIENEDATNIVAARNFVGWYNGSPSDKNLKLVTITSNRRYDKRLSANKTSVSAYHPPRARRALAATKTRRARCQTPEATKKLLDI